MKTTVVVRARNDMPLIRDTLYQLKRQSRPVHIVAFDNHSSDGTREWLEKLADEVIDVPAGEYVPGRILNQGALRAKSDIVAFLNSDCTPKNELWLENLIAPFAESTVSAVFGRQMPRSGCDVLAARDIEETFGNGEGQDGWRHCFSMASSAIRRSVWEEIPFRESLQYSEDIDWSFRVRGAGYQIRYASASEVFHSHNYSASEWRKRQYGEGKAEAAIFTWSIWQRNLLRYSVLPFLRQLVSDFRYCRKRRDWQAILAAPAYRYAQMVGRREGFLAGLRGL